MLEHEYHGPKEHLEEDHFYDPWSDAGPDEEIMQTLKEFGIGYQRNKLVCVSCFKRKYRNRFPIVGKRGYRGNICFDCLRNSASKPEEREES